MFDAFYGLRTDPFRLTPDHQFSFEHEHFSKAKAYIDYALVRGEGFVMITGKPGTGKTTLVTDLQARLPKAEITTATINCTQLDAEALLLICAYEFGLQVESSNKAVMLRELMAFFSREHQAGRRVLLVIDEAQDLSVQALEELRLLTNLQSAGRPLLQIILLGQSSLLGLIRRPEMLQVHQRVVAATHLKALGPEETVEYVRYRLKTAGWQGDPIFRPGVLKTVYAYSSGIPRLINQICSRLLLRGFSLEQHELTRNDAHAVLKELHEEGLIHLPRPGSAQANQVPAIQWSTIDQGLYPEKPEPEKPEEVHPEESHPKETHTETPSPPPAFPPSAIAPASQAPANAAQPVSAPAPTAEFAPPQPAALPSNSPNLPVEPSQDSTKRIAEASTADITEPHSESTALDVQTKDDGSDDRFSHTQPRSSRGLRNFAIAFVVLSLLLLSFLAGMVLSDAEMRQALHDRILHFSNSIADSTRELFNDLPNNSE